MKKRIFDYLIAAAVLSVFSLGCSSQKNASSSDTTAKDTGKMVAPASVTDTIKKDSIKTDTTKKP